MIGPLDDASTSPQPRNVPSAMPPTVPNVAMITDSHLHHRPDLAAGLPDGPEQSEFATVRS